LPYRPSVRGAPFPPRATPRDGGGDDAAPTNPPSPQSIPPLKDQVEGFRSLDAEAVDAAAATVPPTPPLGRDPAFARALWGRAECVAFDIDCTLAKDDALDSLAAFLGKGPAIEALTAAAMSGDLPLDVALQRRLDILDCTPSDLARWHAAHPAEGRLVEGARALVAKLQARGTTVFLISGGLREQQLPLARALGVPPANLFANRLTWVMADDGDDDGDSSDAPPRLAGFDSREPTSRNGGKPAAIAAIRAARPYASLIMVGDGITDAEACSGASGGADAFVAFTGVVARPAVVARADWAVASFATLADALPRKKVVMVGSGAWACAAAKLVASNLRSGAHAEAFDRELVMWVHEEEVGGRPLSSIINEAGENVKYLPGVPLGTNVRAEPDLGAAAAGADVLLFCAPHEFISGIVTRLAALGVVPPGALACSLIKGMRVRASGPQLISEMIRARLGTECSVLMGPNVAEQVAAGGMMEATLGVASPAAADVFVRLMDGPTFRVGVTPDLVGVEMCGTLKNVIALAAGFLTGLQEAEADAGRPGPGADNATATLLRAGLAEMRAFSQRLYPSVATATFLEACGVGDLIASCTGGRNRRTAAAYARALADGRGAGEVEAGPAGFAHLERTLLAGQRLQGVLTAGEVAAVLAARGWAADFPLFSTVYAITQGAVGPGAVLAYREVGRKEGADAVAALGARVEVGV